MGVNHSMFDYFLNAGLVVKLVMLVLIIASIISWTLIFYRGSFLKQAKRQARAFQDRFWDAADITQVYGNLSHRKSPKVLSGLASIFQAGFREFTRYKKQSASISATLDGVERALAIAESRELDKLERSLSLLATIGSTSPYIGLLGTVWGIMTSFQALGSAQQASIAMVAPGISEALVATAMGLFAAIPAVIAYNRFSNTASCIASEYATFREELIAIFARQLQIGSVPRPPEHQPHVADYEDEQQYA